MAKKKATKTKTTSKPEKLDTFVVPAAMKPFIEIMPNQEEVKLSMIVKRYREIEVGGRLKAPTIRRTVDLAKAGTPAVIPKCLDYGITKQLKDGAGERPKGATDTAYATQLEENVDKRIGWFEGEITMQRKAPKDAQGDEAKGMLLAYITGNMQDGEGKTFTAKTLPSGICKAVSMAEVAAAAKAMGVPETKIAEVLNTVKLIEEMRANAVSTSIAAVQ